jgi:hypothetical protein
VGRGPARVDPQVATDGPAGQRQRLQERSEEGLILRASAEGRRRNWLAEVLF